tara:strand:- start:1730 stop:3886 length:2157 start_codon:yes stop_codon:yes gene_type:complete
LFWALTGYLAGILMVWHALPLPVWLLGLVGLCLLVIRPLKNPSVAVIAAGFAIVYTHHCLAPVDTIPQRVRIITPPTASNAYSIKLTVRAYPWGRTWVANLPRKTPRDALRYGDILAIEATRITPQAPTNPGGFDYAKYLKKHRHAGHLRIESYTQTARFIINPLAPIAYALKQRIQHIHARTLPPDYRDLLIGLVFGQHGTQLPDEWVDNFQRTGLTHLLVVSGSQVALISGICFNLLQLMGLSMRNRILGIGLINGLFYIMTGGGPSIFRAMVMMMLALLLKWRHQITSPAHIMGTTLAILGLINPLSWLQTGTHLSFLATAALIFGVPKITESLPEWPKWLSLVLAMSLAPFIFTAAALWFVFGQISTGSLLTNILVGFWIEWLVIIGFFSSAIGLLAPIITDIINFSCLGMMQLLTGLVNTVAQWPGMVISLGKPSLWTILALYALIAKLSTQHAAIRFNRYHGGWGVALIVGLWLPSLWITQPFRIFFLDVGQGDSCIIQTPNRHTIVVDTGPPGSGRYVLGPALRRLGVTAIDLVVLTHWHRDHVGGFNTLKRQFTIGTVLQGTGENTQYAFDDGTFVDTFYQKNTSKNINNQSITTRIRYGQYQFLLTGDLEMTGERELIAHHSQHLPATVLKLGHHGSKTSSTPEFLSAVSPLIGIASAGRNNRYRHPHPKTLNACQLNSIKVYRTDHHGAIAFQTDGTSLYSRTWLTPP